MLGFLLSATAAVMTAAAEPAPDMASFPVPPLLLCDGAQGLVRYNLRTRTVLPLLDGFDVHDVQPQPDGSVLVVGCDDGVALYRKKGGRYVTAWSWEALNLPCVGNAVVASREWEGEPSLVLAGDCTLNRLVLAEAKTRGVRIRWEFPLPAPPRRVSVCGDSGNFLVTLRSRVTGFGEPPKVAEVFYREDRIGWHLDSKDGVDAAQDAVRDRKGRTLVVAGRKPELLCFDLGKKVQWRKGLSMTSKADHTLSLFERGGKTMALVYARTPGTAHRAGKKENRSRNPSGLYLVDVEEGKILAYTRSYMGLTPSGQAPLNIVPEEMPGRRPKE